MLETRLSLVDRLRVCMQRRTREYLDYAFNIRIGCEHGKACCIGSPSRRMHGSIEGCSDTCTPSHTAIIGLVGLARRACSRVGKRLDKARCSPRGYDQRSMGPNAD